MQKNKSIMFLGAFFVVVGSAELLIRAKSICWSLANLFRPGSFASFSDYLYLSAGALFFFIILPLAILTAGIGILRLRRWGWVLAVVVCSITFVVKFIGTMYFAYAVYKSRNLPIPTIPKDVHVDVISMWPTYIYAVISAVLILILTRESIKKAFH